MAYSTLRKLVTEYALEEAGIIDNLVVDSGILQTALVMPSSMGTFHKYKEYLTLPSGTFRNINGTISPTSTNYAIRQLELKRCAALQSEDKDLCEEIGVVKHFNDEKAAFMEGLGQTISTQTIYGNNATYGNVQGFKGFAQIASEKSNTIEGTTQTTGLSTIFAVKYRNRRAGIVINPKLVKGGGIIQQQFMNNSAPTMESDADGALRPVYQVMYNTQLAFLSATNYDVAALHSIDVDGGATTGVTVANLLSLLRMVKGDQGSGTILYCNRIVRDLIRGLKLSELSMSVYDKNFDISVDQFMGIPIVVDDNILSTEASASLPYSKAV